ncbi:hypothetical protein ACJRO7_028467 [Eucalyptus globulus]|uniref:Uncharacterized protein n=1 Tax=Eucalyptus globulus TaxID=34317 RepID=A0ABD3K0G8_EUCGL
MGGSESESSGAITAVGVIAGLAILALGMGVARLIFSGRRTMKAPGMDTRIFRDDFAKNPASYFRNLRKK